MTTTPNLDLSVTLRRLAQHVLDLVDGLGGDEQEQERADDIAAALRDIAEGRPPFPLEDHEVAREAWASNGEKAFAKPFSNHDRALGELTALLDSIQTYADAQGLLFDDENRDNIDAALCTLLRRLDGWGTLARYVPARCLDWRVRFDEQDAHQ
jgi:hypothetical protein